MMMRASTFTVLALSSVLSFACSEPTLEEACTSYCEAAADEGCGELQPAECSVGCSQLEQALIDAGRGACLDHCTALLDCADSRNDARSTRKWGIIGSAPLTS